MGFKLVKFIFLIRDVFMNLNENVIFRIFMDSVLYDIVLEVVISDNYSFVKL